MPEPIRPRVFRGTHDALPEELLPRNELVRRLRAVFERYGFAPLETPAMEYLDILLGKYGEEGEKLIYRLAYKGGDVLALRYDLTVPLSRVVAMNPGLPRPFKRYQIQPVWRADSPQIARGRFREFIQCDVDTVGTASMAADAENLACVGDALRELGLDEFVIRMNHRKLLLGLVRAAGLEPAAAGPLLRAVDKLDKIGMEGVRRELAGSELDADAVDRVLSSLAIEGSPRDVLAQAADRVQGSEVGREGADELGELLDLAEAAGVPPASVSLDLFMVRGLDYYTGPIYEVGLGSGTPVGSVAGGGRYDDLMSVYGIEPVPATGISIGLSRVLQALLGLGLLGTRSSPTEVLVMRFPDTPLAESLRLATELRAAGVAAEIVYEAPRLKKQFQLAERRGVPVAVILGTAELEQGSVNLKRLATGEQLSVPRVEVTARVRGLLGRGEA